MSEIDIESNDSNDSNESTENNDKIFVVVDYRERELYERLRLLISDEGIVTTSNLLMGDIVFVRGGCSPDSNGLLYLERKTIADLSSSISDGRYHEQKQRITSNVERGRIVYVVEGRIPSAPTHYMSDVKITSIHSALLHTAFRDTIVVHRTTDCNDTAVFIHQLWKRIVKTPDEWDGYFRRSGVACVVDKALYMKRSDNNKPEVAFVNMLAQVNGCSARIAEAITKKYVTMYQLIMAYHAEPCESRPKMLENIVVEKRRIGKVLSNRIYEHLCVSVQ